MKCSLPLRNKLEHVVIVGGGIGGLTASIALTKTNQFKTVTVIEKNPTVGSKQGSGIALWRNSLRALDQLGVKKDLEDKGRYLTSSMSYRNSRGVILAEPPVTFTEKFPILCLQRSDLHSVLHQFALSSGTSILNGHVTGLQDASEIASVDPDKTLFVGADGVHSPMRSLISAQKPLYLKYKYWRATLPAPPTVDASEAYEIWFNNGRFGCVPLRSPEMFWFYSEPCSDGVVLSDVSFEDKKEYLLGLLRGNDMNESVMALVEQTPAADIIETPIHKIVMDGSWCSQDGKMVLLGDACHATAPNLAQGAGLAIEDALQLASSFQSHSDPVAACSHYERIRVPRARTVQFLADTIATVGHLPYPQAHCRDILLSGCPQFIAGPIFESAVSYSLGGNYTPPPLS